MPKIIKRKGIPIKGWFLLPPLAIGTPVLTTRTLVAEAGPFLFAPVKIEKTRMSTKY